MRKHLNQERGIALLITLLVMTVLLGVSAGLLNITLKQFQFSSIGLQSEMAFQAANAGMECMLYHDYLNFSFTGTAAPESKFDIGKPSPTIACMNVGAVAANPSIGTAVDNGEEQKYQFSWGNPAVCTDVSIFKYSGPVVMTAALGSVNCPAGVVCTVIRSRGYSTSCANITNPRTVERELVQRY